MQTASDSHRRARPLLGTFVDITLAGAARSLADRAIEAAFDAIAEVHRLMSFHDPDSDVGRLNREAAARAVPVHFLTFQVLETALSLHERSDGVFDVAVAPALQRLGLLPPLADARPATAMQTGKDAIQLLPRRNVRFRHPGVRIDLGGIAKGFAVDRAVAVLRDHGVPRGLVNAGGDLAAFGGEAQTIYLRDPRAPYRLMARVEVCNEGLASSGGCADPFRCSGAAGSAVIDPRTRDQVRAIRGATVRAPSCMIADALTKVVMIKGEAAAPLLDCYGACALLVAARGQVRVTSDWRGAAHLAA
jgi:thiamine biosynthesis lipoprotein